MTIHVVEKTEGRAAEKKTARGKCIVYQCRRTAGKGRSVCNTCRDRAWRAKHPEHHLWKNLKKSAKNRGVEFTITVKEFTGFCRDHNFVTKVGRGPEDATIDRENPSLGYSLDNLRVLTFRENSALGRPLAFSGHRLKGQTLLPLTAAEPAPIFNANVVPDVPGEEAF
jgi:hypothetical protein